MLAELFRTGLQLVQMVGLVCLLWGVLTLVLALWGGGGRPLTLVKDVALIMFGAYLAGMGRLA